MSTTKVKTEWLDQQDPRTFMDLPEIREAFIGLNVRVKGVTKEDAETFYEKEAMYLKRVIHASYDANKPDNYLGRCTPFSLYSCFMDMAANGETLSFNPADKLCYIEKRNYKAGRGEDGKDVWQARARLIISPYGELAIRMDAGQVAYADPAIVVYEGDLFNIGTDDRGNTVVQWQSKVPRASNKVIGSFVKITRPNGSYVMPYFLQEDINRLMAYSKKGNQGKWINPLYGDPETGTGIDTGFLKAKTLKHAFTVFPKVKLRGTNSAIDELEAPDEQEEGLDHLRGNGSAPAKAPVNNISAPTQNWDKPVPQDKGITVPIEEEETF